MLRFEFLRGFGTTNLLLCAVWLVAVGWGLVILFNYGHQPGDSGVQPNRWPGDSSIKFSGERPIVLFFAHPHCPCTRASLSELESAFAVCPHPTDFVLVSLDCRPDCSEWRDSDLVAAAQNRIPGLQVLWDRHGDEAQRFGIRTSGHVVTYARNGQAGFSGGITASRGHEGSNRGRAALEKWLRLNPNLQDQQQQLASAPVFGCTMMDQDHE